LHGSDAAQQELSSLLQQAAAPDAHNSFELSSGGETWEQNVRRIATDVVCKDLHGHASSSLS